MFSGLSETQVFFEVVNFSGETHFRLLLVPDMCKALKNIISRFFFFTKRLGDDLLCGGGGVGVGIKILLQMKGLVYRLSRDCHFDIDSDVYFLDLS